MNNRNGTSISYHLNNHILQHNQQNNPFYHNLNIYIRDICMYVNDQDVEMLTYINSQMCVLLQQCMQFSSGNFDPSSINQSENIHFAPWNANANERNTP